MENLTQLACENSIDSTQNSDYRNEPLIPYYSLYNDRLVIHPRPMINITKRKIHDNSIKNLKKPKYSGYMSPATSSRVKKILTSWCNSMLFYNQSQKSSFKIRKHVPVFATTTLSYNQIHSDKKIKRLILDPFIKAVKRKFEIDHYFWRAESQENGRIHFHFIFDRYIPHKEFRLLWNHYQDKLNYIKNFAEKSGNENPNSTDIKGVKDVNDFVEYVIKYCAKEGEYREIKGQIWGMSDSLRNCKIYQDLLDWDLSDKLNKGVQNESIRKYTQEYYSVFIFTKAFKQTNDYKSIMWRSGNYYIRLYKQLYLHPPVKKRLIDTVKERIISGEKQGCLFNSGLWNSLIERSDNNEKSNKKYYNVELEKKRGLKSI